MSKMRYMPRIQSRVTPLRTMSDVILALVPALGMGVYFFGGRVLMLVIVSIVSCVLFEAGYQRAMGRNITVLDLSAVVTGLLLALCLPATAPLWAPVLGGFFAIVVVKQFYGGFGHNFLNPALAGRMILATFPGLMTSWVGALSWQTAEGAVDAVSHATPMSYLHNGVLPPETIRELFLGYQGGSIGEVSTVMLVLGGLYLAHRGVIRVGIPLTYIGTVAVICYLFPQGNDPMTWMLANLCSGGLMLGAIFMASDCITSPTCPRGQLIYGVLCGALTMLLRQFGSYPEGVGWAILTMNCGVWLLDRAGMPRRFGEKRFSELRRFCKRFWADVSGIRLQMPELMRRGEMPMEAYIDDARAFGRSVLSLGAVVSATVLLVFGVHYATDLAARQEISDQEQALLGQVMPTAQIMTDTPYHDDLAASISAGYDENALVGYCVEVQVAGFGGPMTLMVGVDVSGRVTGIAVLDHKETLTVGTDALTEEYFQKFVGQSGTMTEGRIDAVSGATNTSRAVMEGVNRALAVVARLEVIADANLQGEV